MKARKFYQINNFEIVVDYSIDNEILYYAITMKKPKETEYAYHFDIIYVYYFNTTNGLYDSNLYEKTIKTIKRQILPYDFCKIIKERCIEEIADIIMKFTVKYMSIRVWGL